MEALLGSFGTDFLNFLELLASDRVAECYDVYFASDFTGSFNELLSILSQFLLASIKLS
jgi:hypothetical protein